MRLLVRWVILGVSLLSLLGIIAYLILQNRLRKRPFPSFVTGLVDMANFGREVPAIVLLAGFLLLNHLVNLIPEKDALALGVCLSVLLLTVGVVYVFDLITPPLPPSSELVPTPGLIVFMGRMRGDSKSQLDAINQCPDNPCAWQKAIKRAEELYQKVANELKGKGTFTLQQVSEEVKKRLKGEVGDKIGNEKRIWECVISLADTPIFAALRAVAYHSGKLEYVWAMVSDEAKDSFQVFEAVLKKTFPKVKCRQIPLKDANDPIAIKDDVNSAYRQAIQFGLSEEQVTTDITGGSAIMSVGGALACVRSRRRLQYLRQDNFQFIAVPVTIASLREAIDELLEQLPMVMRKSP